MKFINCTLARGGTSKGVIFLKEDLPNNEVAKFNTILKIMGAPDAYGNQVQGLGAGKSTNNKVAIISKSTQKDIDINYLFAQVTPKSNMVDTKPNCGNFIAAVPVFAIFKSLVKVDNSNSYTVVKIFNENTQQIIHAKVKTKNNQVDYNGTTTIAVVIGNFSPIELQFFNVQGSQTHKLFPTNNYLDVIDGIEVSCIDVAVPTVIINGERLNINADVDLKLLKSGDFIIKLEKIRAKATELMGLEYNAQSVLPKLAIVCKTTEADIKVYYYDPFALHDTVAVTGGMAIASCTLFENTVANKHLKLGYKVQSGNNRVIIEHQSGIMETNIELDKTCSNVVSGAFIRTASILMEGKAFLY